MCVKKYIRFSSIGRVAKLAWHREERRPISPSQDHPVLAEALTHNLQQPEAGKAALRCINYY